MSSNDAALLDENVAGTSILWHELNKPPLFLKLRSSTAFIGVTAFVAAFTVLCSNFKRSNPVLSKGLRMATCIQPYDLYLTLKECLLKRPIQVVPILPYSLVERSGVPEANG